ncbi:Protein timeless, partial [Blattella germanica]
SNIFYVVEYRELILTLTLNFDEIKFSKSYLKDLLETAHVFLKMLEQFSSKRNIVVQKRHTARKRKTKKSNPKPQASAPTRNPEEIWDEEISQQLSTVLQGEVEIPNVVPFDATSERDIDEQR